MALTAPSHFPWPYVHDTTANKYGWIYEHFYVGNLGAYDQNMDYVMIMYTDGTVGSQLIGNITVIS